jgi:flagellar basal body-associated protein FliL
LCRTETKFAILDWMNDTDGKTETNISLDELITQGGSNVESSSADMDPAKLDALLFSQDPKFKEKINELRTLEVKGEIEVDMFDSGALESLEIKRDKVSPPSPEEQKIKLPLKDQIRSHINSMLTALTRSLDTENLNFSAIVGKILAFFRDRILKAVALITQFRTLPFKTKVSVIGLFSLTVMLAFMVKMIMEGDFLPSFEMRLIPTVAANADQSWNYDEKEPVDDFFSSIRHPEHIVLLERLVVNVKSSEGSGPNPMGFFEFYIEASTEDAAIEINDRKAEVKDAMQRTIEGITYDELVTPAGKNKLKLILRKNINSVLTKGRVRKLFFKSVVIKP